MTNRITNDIEWDVTVAGVKTTATIVYSMENNAPCLEAIELFGTTIDASALPPDLIMFANDEAWEYEKGRAEDDAWERHRDEELRDD